MSPFFFIKNWTIVRFSIVSIRNSHIFTHWAYFTQISNESQICTQMTIFSHIEHISHEYSIKVKFSHKWPYFHTLSIFHTNIKWKPNFHTSGHIFTHWAYLLLSITVLIFEILDFCIVVVAQVRSFIGRWYSWLGHRGDERRNLIKLIKLFLIDGILNSDDSSFSRYNHLKSFVCCVYNIEHLSNVFLLTQKAPTYILNG
jgi:hypothetical protein